MSKSSEDSGGSSGLLDALPTDKLLDVLPTDKLTDDLRLAHLLADDADSITMSRFKALDLQIGRASCRERV